MRYGHNRQNSGISGLGGPIHTQWLAGSTNEDMLGFDDRTQVPGGSFWTGDHLNGDDQFARVPVWLPEIELDRHVARDENSLVASTRKPENLFAVIHGPEEGLTIPLRLVITPRDAFTTTGEVHPGWLGPPNDRRTIIDGQFQPPIVPPAPSSWPGLGAYSWPLTLGSRGSHLRLTNGKLWYLPVTWRGVNWSDCYGDLEVELAIPNPSNVAFSVNHVTWPEKEGILYCKLGTVCGMDQLSIDTEPGVNWDDLLDHWYRRAFIEVYPLDVKPEMVTVGFGLNVTRNQDVTNPRELRFAAVRGEARVEKYAANYQDEIMFNAVNRWLGVDQEDSRYGVLEAELPHDLSKSLQLESKAYLGTIAYNRTDQDTSYDSEAFENATYGGVTLRQFAVSFLDIQVDSDNNGTRNAEDEDDEEAAPGMIVTGLQRIELRLSDPVESDEYDGCTVLLSFINSNSWSDLKLYADEQKQIELNPDEAGTERMLYLTHVEGVLTWSTLFDEIATGTTCTLWVEPTEKTPESVSYLLARLCDASADAIAADRAKMTMTRITDFTVGDDRNSDNEVTDGTDDDSTPTAQTLFVIQDAAGAVELRLDIDWVPVWLTQAQFGDLLLWEMEQVGGGAPSNWSKSSGDFSTASGLELAWEDPGGTSEREFLVVAGLDVDHDGTLSRSGTDREAIRLLRVTLVKIKDFEVADKSQPTANSKTDSADSDSTPTDAKVYLLQDEQGEAELELGITWEPSTVTRADVGSLLLFRIVLPSGDTAPGWDPGTGSFSTDSPSVSWSDPGETPARSFHIFAGCDVDGDGALDVSGTDREACRKLEVGVLAIEQSEDLWWFNGEYPDDYAVEVTLTVAGETSGTFAWTVTEGTSKVDLNNGGAGADSITATNDNSVTLISVAASAGAATLTNDITISLKLGSITLGSFETVVLAPDHLVHLQNRSSAHATNGYETFIDYRIEDQFNRVLPDYVPVNELWTGDVVNDYTGTDWSRSVHSGTLISPDSWFDLIRPASDWVEPTPVGPGDTGDDTAIHHWEGEWRVGSTTPGDGVLVSCANDRWADDTTCVWKRYRGHADHE